jgi:hypothetical protein
LKYLLILSAAFLGMVGLIIAGLVILGHAAMQNSFGVGYLEPWSPIRLRELGDTVIRRPLWLKWRPGTYQPQDQVRYRQVKEEKIHHHESQQDE